MSVTTAAKTLAPSLKSPKSAIDSPIEPQELLSESDIIIASQLTHPFFELNRKLDNEVSTSPPPKNNETVAWSTDEKMQLIDAVIEIGSDDWSSVSKLLKTRRSKVYCRPCEWYEPSKCSAQFRKLVDDHLDRYDTEVLSSDQPSPPKRLKRSLDQQGNETEPTKRMSINEFLKRCLAKVRVEELQRQSDAYLEEMKKLGDDIKFLESTDDIDDVKLDEMESYENKIEESEHKRKSEFTKFQLEIDQIEELTSLESIEIKETINADSEVTETRKDIPNIDDARKQDNHMESVKIEEDMPLVTTTTDTEDEVRMEDDNSNDKEQQQPCFDEQNVVENNDSGLPRSRSLDSGMRDEQEEIERAEETVEKSLELKNEEGENSPKADFQIGYEEDSNSRLSNTDDMTDGGVDVGNIESDEKEHEKVGVIDSSVSEKISEREIDFKSTSQDSKSETHSNVEEVIENCVENVPMIESNETEDKDKLNEIVFHPKISPNVEIEISESKAAQKPDVSVGNEKSCSPTSIPHTDSSIISEENKTELSNASEYLKSEKEDLKQDNENEEREANSDEIVQEEFSGNVEPETDLPEKLVDTVLSSNQEMNNDSPSKKSTNKNTVSTPSTLERKSRKSFRSSQKQSSDINKASSSTTPSIPTSSTEHSETESETNFDGTSSVVSESNVDFKHLALSIFENDTCSTELEVSTRDIFFHSDVLKVERDDVTLKMNVERSLLKIKKDIESGVVDNWNKFDLYVNRAVFVASMAFPTSSKVYKEILKFWKCIHHQILDGHMKLLQQCDSNNVSPNFSTTLTKQQIISNKNSESGMLSASSSRTSSRRSSVNSVQ